jgi:hypothetical protein
MNLLLVAIALSAATLSGLALGRPVFGGLSKSEMFAWSLALGFMAQALLFVLALLIPIAPTVTLAMASVALMLPLLGRGTGGGLEPVPAKLSITTRFLLAAAAAGIALFAAVALSEPMWSTDYLAVWGLKAKTIFLTAALPARLFHDPATAWSHPEYPLLLPLDLAALSAWARGWDDRAPALLYPLLQAATAAGIFGFLARRGQALGGAAAAVLTAWLAPFYTPVHVGMADIPLALGFVLLASALLDAFDADVSSSLSSSSVRARLAAASLFCAALKPEGALFSLLAAIVWLFFRPAGARRAGVLAALALPAIAFGALQRLARGPIPERIFDFGLLAPGRWGEWLGRLGLAVSHIASVEAAAAAIPLVALAGFFFVTKRATADRLLPLLGGQAAFYVVACSLSAIGVVWHLESSFARTTCTLFPALALVVGARLSSR